jgi:hypothetical protein
MLNMNAKRKTWWNKRMMAEVPYACFVSLILYFPDLNFVCSILVPQETIIHVVTNDIAELYM